MNLPLDLILEFMWKAVDSGAGGCPAMYKVEGGYVVQGVKLDDNARAQLRDLANNEDAVYVPSDVIDRIRAQA